MVIPLKIIIPLEVDMLVPILVSEEFNFDLC